MKALLTATILFLATLSFTADASASRVAGTYTGAVGGEQAVLVLKTDGTGTLMGETGRWSAQGKTVRLVDSEGTEVVGTLKGDALVFRVDGGVLRFTRAKRFAPKLLPGKVVTPDDGDGSFRVPRSWTHGWDKGLDDKEAYVMVSRDKKAAVMVGRRRLSKKESASTTDTLLLAGLEELLSGVDYSREIEAESFLVGGRLAGRVVIRATVEDVAIEGYLGAVITKDWAYTITALYQSKYHKLGRSAADTVLATLRVKPPKPAPRVSAKVAGCWKRSSANGGGGGKIVLRLNANGTYTRYESTIIVGGGMSGSSSEASEGRWSTAGNTLTLAPKGARRTSNRFGFNKSGGLVLDGRAYYRCK